MRAEDGLSQNSVNDIYEDCRGFLWFATQDGLNRYDGYEFQIFSPGEDSFGISDNFIVDITPKSCNEFWALCRYGLNLYDHSSNRFIQYQDPKFGRMSVPKAVFRWHNRWVASYGENNYYIDTNTTDWVNVHSELAIDLPRGIWTAMRTEACLLLCTEQELMAFDPTGELLFSLPIHGSHGYDQGLRMTADGPVLMIGSQLLRVDVSAPALLPILSLAEGTRITDVVYDHEQCWWIGHTKGIVMIAGEDTLRVKADPDRYNGLSYPLVHSLLEDRQNNIWVGTANGGLNIVPSGARKFKVIDERTGLPHPQVWSAAQDTEGRRWIGTEQGLALYDREWQPQPIPAALQWFNEQRITALGVDTIQQLWIGTTNGTFVYAPKTGIRQIHLLDDNENNLHTSCFLQHDGKMWIGTLGRLFHCELSAHAASPYDVGSDSNAFRYLLSLAAIGDELWVGSGFALSVIHKEQEHNMCYFFDPSNASIGPPFQFITGIVPTDSVHWFSTFGGGLSRFDPNTREFTHFNTDHGLKNNIVSGLLSDGKLLWLCHNQGISRFDPKHKRFFNLDVEDGIAFHEFSLGGSGWFGDDCMFFSGTNGLVGVRPQDFEGAKYPALQPLITDFSINYERRAVELPEQLVLYPEDKVVSFRFAALDLLRSKNLSYNYMLEGFDDQWATSAVNDRRATYSSLPAGKYLFRVRAASMGGDWSDLEFQLPIEVHPPLWQRWWFMLLMGLALLGITAVTVRYFSQLKIKRRLAEMEAKEKIHRERSRISMDLHDHVGAHITYLISNLDQMAFNPQKTNEFSGLSDYAREAMRELRDTVWAIRKDRMSAAALADRIQAFGQRLFEHRDTEFNLSSNGLDDIVLEPTPALHILRIAQECLQNAFKHARATQVKVALEVTEQRLTLSIWDNGEGMAQDADDARGTGNGLENIQTRADEIGAQLHWESTPGQGVNVTLIHTLQLRQMDQSTESKIPVP